MVVPSLPSHPSPRSLRESPSPAEGRGEGDDADEIPTFAELAADPEIAALLDFEPVPRKRKVEGGWTPELQREFIARLAYHGSAGKACDEMGKNLTGMMKIYRSPPAPSFRAAWHAAVELATRRRDEAVPEGPPPMSKPPTIDHRFKVRRSHALVPYAGAGGTITATEVEEARDSISGKLRRARRFYLAEICGSPGKRAAFEILTELPVDWEKAERLEPQPDEPWRAPTMRQPDMLLTAENGWLGEVAHGPDKMAELRRMIDEHRAGEGLEPVEWEEG